MAQMIGKGTVLSMSATTTLAAVAQVIDISHSGAESETYDSTTLDQAGVGKSYAANGYSEGGSVDFGVFYDSALAGHQLFGDQITTPADTYYSLKLADGTTNASTFTGAGLSLGFDVAMDDGVKANVSVKLTGLYAYQT